MATPCLGYLRELLARQRNLCAGEDGALALAIRWAPQDRASPSDPDAVDETGASVEGDFVREDVGGPVNMGCGGRW